jgi:fumarate reductase flavoprotein subunit
MMGGIHTDINAATPIAGLYAAGECACVSINGANRLGSNSLGELLVFGARAARHAVELAKTAAAGRDATIDSRVKDAEDRIKALFKRSKGTQRVAALRSMMNTTLEEGCGIYRDAASLQATCTTINEVRGRYKDVSLEDKSTVFNTDLYQTLELGAMIEVAQTVAESAVHRTESRGAHQRLDFPKRDDVAFLKHSMAVFDPSGPPRIDYLDVVITKSQPAERVYGGGAGGQVAA